MITVVVGSLNHCEISYSGQAGKFTGLKRLIFAGKQFKDSCTVVGSKFLSLKLIAPRAPNDKNLLPASASIYIGQL
jgi:hypothetical protein